VTYEEGKIRIISVTASLFGGTPMD